MYGRVPDMPIPRGDGLLDLSLIEEATCETVTTGHESTKMNHCAVIFDERNFGSVDVIDTDQFQKSELVPSQRVDLTTLTSVSRAECRVLSLSDRRYSLNPLSQTRID